MSLLLPPDVWTQILWHCSFSEVAALRAVSKEWKHYILSLDDIIKTWYATCVLRDSRFWTLAEKRPPSRSRPLPTYFAEIVRIEGVQHLLSSRMFATDFYELWTWMDSD